jgi:hypothetical protein
MTRKVRLRMGIRDRPSNPVVHDRVARHNRRQAIQRP